MEFKISDIGQLDLVSDHLRSLMSNYRIFLLTGGLGAGKTTLVKSWMKSLAITDQVTSPTFSLINNYQSDLYDIYHMDLYRLKSIEEVLELGFMEFVDNTSAHIIIEWPELVLPLIDYPFIKVDIDIAEDGRSYKLSIGQNTT